MLRVLLLYIELRVILRAESNMSNDSLKDTCTILKALLKHSLHMFTIDIIEQYRSQFLMCVF